MSLEKVLYRTTARATGGRDGHSGTLDGKVDVKLAVPKEMGGNGDGVNPEQLFATGWSACFLGAIRFVAGKEKIAISPEATVETTVGIGTLPTGFGLEAELKITLPGLTREQAEALVQKAHVVCPYSNATRGNIDVKLAVV
jgi:lipoyl-dependent peroxiredoxin